MTILNTVLASNPVTRTIVRETAKKVDLTKGVNRNNARRVAELIQLRVNPLIPPLSEQGYKNEAARYGIRPEALHAFADVESQATGSTVMGRLPILYEPHVVSRNSFHLHDWWEVPGMGVVCSYPRWYNPRKKSEAIPPNCSRHPYNLKMEERFQLLAFMAEINFDAALAGCSWGMFQVLGENWKALGYASVWHFVVEMCDGGEPAQLNAALRFLDHKDVLDDMRKGNWATVIEAYNGPGQVDDYLPRFLRRLSERRKLYV